MNGAKEAEWKREAAAIVGWSCGKPRNGESLAVASPGAGMARAATVADEFADHHQRNRGRRQDGILDKAGVTSDWLEITNTSSTQTVNLAG